MKVIYKYQLNGENNISISLPARYKILHIGAQGVSVCAWIMIDTDETTFEDVSFRLICTGQEIPNNMTYIGTALVNMLNLVFHVFISNKN